MHTEVYLLTSSFANRGNKTLNNRNLAIDLAAALIVLGTITALSVSGMASDDKAATPSRVTIDANLGIYSESTCTSTLTTIDWQAVSPGSSVTKTIYVKNLGNTQLKLSLSATNIFPAAAAGQIALTWDQEGTTLRVGEVRKATVTLQVSSSASGFQSFSVDIAISGQAIRGKSN